MALKDGSGYYTKFTFVENEQALVRRIHRLEIQAWDGRLYAVEGKQLPDYIGGTSGAGVKNAHVLQILVSKQALKAGLPGGPKLVPWPGQRDLMHMLMGSALLILIIGIIRIVVLAF
jgi:hypothetical protein